MDVTHLRALVQRLTTLSQRLRDDGPQTDEELHAWVKKVIGVDIPRVAVCEDHDPPFKLLADTYFERLQVTLADGTQVEVSGVLALANRGGGKTFIVAIIHYLNAIYKAGCEGLQFGATEAQGNRCYGNIEDWCYERDKLTGRRRDVVKPFVLGKPMKSETNFKTGGKVEVVAGSEKAVSGPHPQKAGADEVDQMEDSVWNQSRGMAVAKQATGPLPDFMAKWEGMIPPTDIVTSTRNSRHGRMQELLTEVEEDIRNSTIPEFQVVKWCIWETMKEIPSCRSAPKEEREARLKELGRDPCELCQCNKVVKGRNKDGSKRTLDQVCKGRGFKSRGYKPYVDLVTTFKRNTPGTWLLQHECQEGKDENVYIEDWSLEYYGIRNYEPKPEYGPIYQGGDWGGTNPHAMLWFQYLQTDVPAFDFNYNEIYIHAGTYILFNEVYIADIELNKLASMVRSVEDGYRLEYGNHWKVADRFYDMQGKGDRLLFKSLGFPSNWPVVTRKKEKMITTVQNIVTDDRFAVDVDKAPMFCEEIEMWGKNPRTGKEVDDFNHAMAAWRYGISNAEITHGGDAPQHDEPGKTKPVNTSERRPEPPQTTRVQIHGKKGSGPLRFRRTSSSAHPVNQFDHSLR